MDNNDRFDLSFRNPIVRMWFYVILPTTIISAILLLVLPMESHSIIQMIGNIIMVSFFTWVFIYKRKNRTNKGDK